MIRPLTTLCLLAACGSGLYLYAEKHRAELLDRKIAGVIRATEAARERTGVLRAEWALLNDPSRLQDLATRYLHLQPMAPAQFVQLSDLGNHLPPPQTPAPAGATDEDAANPDTAAAAPPAPLTLAPLTIAATPDAPEKTADARRPRPTRAALHGTASAAARDSASLRAPPPHPHPLLGAPLVSALAHVPAAPRPRPVPVFTPPEVRSAIGGAGTLPPPVPLTGAQ